jgi:hypothetical protein
MIMVVKETEVDDEDIDVQMQQKCPPFMTTFYAASRCI